MKRVLVMVAFAAAVVSVASCNKNLDKTLFGTWNVVKVEGAYNSNGSTILTGQDDMPTGTVRFDSNGKGRQNYSFTISGTVYEQVGDFKWEANDEEIIIKREGDSDMIWDRIQDTENRQQASYRVIVNATENWDYTLTLEK